MPLKVGDSAPNFELSDIEGNFYSPERVHGKKLLVFYKTTCPTCQLTLPFVEKLYQLYRNHVSVWGIVQDPEQEAFKFAQKYNLNFPQLIDYPGYEVSMEYRVQVVPTLYLVEEGGGVEFVSNSFVKADLKKLNELLASFAGIPPLDLFAGQSVPEQKPG
ncbi:MAG: TlpA family protein disulfide reductase [Aquificaceae bacterium]|nr:TlpA family protein disulfide reductase [Aquificaceae bacterium]MCX7989837.1 TlpA family protein disulfide reductase [Aquificaceae bacterium]MDW8033314.1 TlpA disulfide reductase family protein [Aquificaceae bacterium]MDW8294339.1 TlpA disulfide reductase family protein [Aquificaceae bacterium]